MAGQSCLPFINDCPQPAGVYLYIATTGKTQLVEKEKLRCSAKETNDVR